MARLSKEKKAKVLQFTQVTGQSDSVAQECLGAENWVVDSAVDRYFSAPHLFTPVKAASKASSSADEAEAFFQAYRCEGDTVDAAGIMRLIQDLKIEATDKALIVLSYHCDAESMGEYTKAEFLQGVRSLNATTLAKLRAKLPALRAECSNPDTFAKIYNYTYSFACERDKKNLSLDSAIALWQILFTGPNQWKYTDSWIQYLQDITPRPLVVLNDTWKLLLDFKRNVGEDLDKYDPREAWPYLIDEFVEQMRAEEEKA